MRQRRTGTRVPGRRCSATPKLYGEVAGGQAEYLRVPQANYTHIKVPAEGPDDRYVYLSDVLPTAWQGLRVRRGA